jgi:hypothetical protein
MEAIFRVQTRESSFSFKDTSGVTELLTLFLEEIPFSGKCGQ